VVLGLNNFNYHSYTFFRNNNYYGGYSAIHMVYFNYIFDILLGLGRN